MELYEVMRTTFAARQFTSDKVPNDVLARILDNARFAPSGGNRQGWRVIVIRDQAKRETLVPIVTSVMSRYRAQVNAGENPFNTINSSQVTQADIDNADLPPSYARQFVDAPVLLLVLVDLAVVASMDSELDRVGVVSGGSIYPFAWNILLAARSEGYGGTLTTFLAPFEADVKKLFNIPERYAVSALLPIGKPVKQLTRLRRNPVSSFATVDSFDGETFK
ncbi:MAG: nitroreductase family protein [Gammaproteobacteria bacterium]|nr:nitroreductase family protein [Gammaproteobacteria bacterium]